MPSLPLPFVTLLVLCIFLIKLCIRNPSRHWPTLSFIIASTLLMAIVAIRWSCDLSWLRAVQPIMASALPPLAWYCFYGLTHQHPYPWGKLFIPTAIMLAIYMILPSVTDAILVLIYLGFGCALIRLARRGADAFGMVPFNSSMTAPNIALICGVLLCFSGITDLLIALDFSLFNGQQAPLLVAIAQTLLLPLLCLAIVFAGKISIKTEGLAEKPGAEVEYNSEELAQTCASLENTIREKEWYLDAELTLDRLARKSGIPARHISRMVNTTRGCNVSQWINQFRIAKTQQLLISTTLPVTQIMLEVGFITKSNFNREFLRLTGMNPSDYRRGLKDSPTPETKTP